MKRPQDRYNHPSWPRPAFAEPPPPPLFGVLALLPRVFLCARGAGTLGTQATCRSARMRSSFCWASSSDLTFWYLSVTGRRAHALIVVGCRARLLVLDRLHSDP